MSRPVYLGSSSGASKVLSPHDASRPPMPRVRSSIVACGTTVAAAAVCVERGAIADRRSLGAPPPLDRRPSWRSTAPRSARGGAARAVATITCSAAPMIGGTLAPRRRARGAAPPPPCCPCCCPHALARACVGRRATAIASSGTVACARTVTASSNFSSFAQRERRQRRLRPRWCLRLRRAPSRATCRPRLRLRQRLVIAPAPGLRPPCAPRLSARSAVVRLLLGG